MAAREWTKRLPSPSTLYISSACYSENTNLILQELRESFDRSREAAKQSFWKLADDPFGIANAVRLYCENDCIATWELWDDFNKTNNEKEKEKMDAKKCDRCGKLYIETHEGIRAFLNGRVSNGEKETYTPEKIKEINTYNIKVVLNSTSAMDLCPECREKLKNFFESGADEAKE